MLIRDTGRFRFPRYWGYYYIYYRYQKVRQHKPKNKIDWMDQGPGEKTRRRKGKKVKSNAKYVAIQVELGFLYLNYPCLTLTSKHQD